MTHTLFTYQQEVQRLLREAKQGLSNPDDLRAYINTARREIAMRSQAIRIVTPICGSILECSVTEPGSGYSDSPTVTISAPDFPSGGPIAPNGRQATAIATVQFGTISGIDITDGGAGYFQPTVTIEDDTGSGAEAELTLSDFNVMVAGQEEYRFSDIDLSAFSGVKEIYFVRSVSIIYSNYRYSLPCYAFSTYQAMIRQYPFQYRYVPTFCAQVGQGAAGTLYLYPLPSQVFQMEWDCQCIPIDLENNQSIEALPNPWTDAVKYFAAHLAMLELQNFNAAKFYLEMYEKFAQRYSDYPRAGRVTNPYGRY